MTRRTFGLRVALSLLGTVHRKADMSTSTPQAKKPPKDDPSPEKSPYDEPHLWGRSR